MHSNSIPIDSAVPAATSMMLTMSSALQSLETAIVVNVDTWNQACTNLTMRINQLLKSYCCGALQTSAFMVVSTVSASIANTYQHSRVKI
eukprot:3325090-Amphidinium_carterae.1